MGLIIGIDNGSSGGSAPVGATLMRTGATTSYRTGDDADTSSDGRAVDFLTLPSNNPFGNTNRFTDELGTQTYTNNIVIDWSTYNGSTVLGVYRVNFYVKVAVNWNDAIDNALALSIGTFTTGWRLWNKIEAVNFMNQSSFLVYGYSPLNATGNGAVYWVSDTPEQYTTNSYIAKNDGTINTVSKGGLSGFSLAVKTFTVTGTTLS